MGVKNIEIESANCLVESSTYGFYINGVDIRDILNKAFEDALEKDKKYPAYLKIEISAVDEEPLKIKNNWDKKENILLREDAAKEESSVNNISIDI